MEFVHILILWVTVSGQGVYGKGGIESVEFANGHACAAALLEIRRQSGGEISGVCVARWVKK